MFVSNLVIDPINGAIIARHARLIRGVKVRQRPDHDTGHSRNCFKLCLRPVMMERVFMYYGWSVLVKYRSRCCSQKQMLNGSRELMMKKAGTKDKDTCKQLEEIELIEYSQLQQLVLAKRISITE